MKHLTLTLGVAVAALFTIPSTSFAQDKPAGEAPAGRGAGRFSPEERLKHMTETLGLTQEQQDKIKAIYAKNAPAIKEIMGKGYQNLSDEDKTKMRELMKAQMEEVNAVLTQEQKDKMKAEMEKRGAGRRGGPGKPEAPKADPAK